MKINDDTNFHWSNYLSPTPPLIFWLFTVAEAIVLAINGTQIVEGASKWVVLSLLILQTVIGKAVPFFGKIKDDFEAKQKLTITATGEVDVKQETIPSHPPEEPK